MSEREEFDADKILKDLFRSVEPVKSYSLRELFDNRARDLGVSRTSATHLIGLQSRTLKGILDGTQKRVDPVALHRVASFLQMTDEQVTQMYLSALRSNYPDDLSKTASADKVQFLRENFDLVALKKAGFIKSITDYADIEARINHYFGLRSIEDYQRPIDDVAFSAGVVKPKNALIRSTWISAARDAFKLIDNPHPYSRDALVEFFPQIRWHSTNVKLGMPNVIKHLFKIGVTVFYLPSLPSLHLRGATFSVLGKPCVVLTNYRDFYPTLWFALVHELFHVIFDWDEIKRNTYHLSDEDVDQLSVKEREDEADDFAREYLFSKEKSEAVRPYLRDASYVRHFAELNHVHESFVYVFNAFDTGKTDRMSWPRAQRFNPDFGDLLDKLGNHWNAPKSITDFVKGLENTLYR